MKRSLSMLAALVLLVAAAQPVAGACCPPRSHASAMVASMPCCAGTCPVMKVAPHQNAVSAILTGATAAPVLVPVATIAAIPPVSRVSLEIQATHQESPPPFLLHEQFRI